MKRIGRNRPIDVTGVRCDHPPLLGAPPGTHRAAPQVPVRALELVVPHVRPELEVLSATPAAIDAGEDGGVGEALEGVMADGIGGRAVRGGAAVADAPAVRLDVDRWAGEVVAAGRAPQVVQDGLGDVLAADICKGGSGALKQKC